MSDLRDPLQAVIAQWREEADRLENRYGFSPNDVIRGAFMAEVQRLRYCAADLESLLSADPPQAQETRLHSMWHQNGDWCFRDEFGATWRLTVTGDEDYPLVINKESVTGDRSPAGET